MKLITNKKAFTVLWSGQSLSLLGSSLTRFALMIWAFQNNSGITSMVLLGFFSAIAFIAASPFAGVVTDRVNRKWVMLFADLGSGLATLALLLLSLNGELQFWHLYLVEGLSGLFEAFQSPAFFSSVSQLVPRDGFTRANSMIGISKSFVQVLAPVFSSLILSFSGLEWVMGIDLFTLLLGIGAVLLVSIPKPEQTSTGIQAEGNFWHEFRFGFRYIHSQPGLRMSLLIFVGINLFAGFTYMSILSPMILIRTGGDKIALGTIQTVMGIGGILGGVLLTLLPSPKKKAAMFAWATLVSFGTCDLFTAASRSVVAWCVSGFLSEFGIPFIVNPYFAIWQERVPVDVQGRVFSVRDMIQNIPTPLGFILGGLMADYVFEPFFSQPTFLSPLVGSGPGAGMSAMFLITCICGALTGLSGVVSPVVRKLDEE